MQWFRVALLAVLLILAGTGLVVERQLRHLNHTMRVVTAQQLMALHQTMQQTALLTVLQQGPQWTRSQEQLHP